MNSSMSNSQSVTAGEEPAVGVVADCLLGEGWSVLASAADALAWPSVPLLGASVLLPSTVSASLLAAPHTPSAPPALTSAAFLLSTIPVDELEAVCSCSLANAKSSARVNRLPPPLVAVSCRPPRLSPPSCC